MYTQNLSEYSLTLFFTFYSDSDIAVEQIAQRDRVYFSREVVYKSFFCPEFTSLEIFKTCLNL